MTSQHPYAEEFIGEPHVFTVDINEKDELRSVIKRALELISSNEVGCDRHIQKVSLQIL